MRSCLPVGLKRHQLVDMEREAKDYSLINGIVLRVKDAPDEEAVEMAPSTLFPSPFPRKAFDLAKSIQASMNLLFHRMAYDSEFLSQSLKSTIEVDDFTASLLSVNDQVARIGKAQPYSLGLFRADYMLNEADNSLKQIEMNAIASGFASLGPKVRGMHHHFMSKYSSLSKEQINKHLPENRASEKFVDAFVNAWEHYGNAAAVILVVTEDRTINISDQRGLEFAINRKRPDIKTIRRSFLELNHSVDLKGNQLLFIDHEVEVAVVYYRYTYAPEHFPTPDFWALRLRIEKSRAIKCPSINYHLAGVKKIQQVVVDLTILEKFLEPQEAAQVHSTFAGLWGFEMNAEGDRAVEMALRESERFVMKPQREGGGNNFYGDDIVKELQSIKHSREREAYILMELIRPPVISNVIVTPNVKISTDETNMFHDIVGELGIFGAIMGSDSEVVFNYEAGHVLRSKKLGVNEGGIAAGFGAIDSPFIY